MQDIFVRIEPTKKLDSKFILLDEKDIYEPAKKLVEKIAADFEDKDGNFIQQFQTTGFNSRMWELFLVALFKQEDFEFIEEHDRPDFHLRKNDCEIFVEASISTEKSNDIYTKEFIKEAIALQDFEIQNELIEYYIVRMGSVLLSKLQKEYWKLEWVKNKPLVFAITPFHNYIADFIPDAKIIEYLYGVSHDSEITVKGLELKEVKKIDCHTHKDKEIPSNFFNQPNVEKISAVIFTNNCNLSKFNRMGHQEGLSDKELIIVRSGLAYDPTPNSQAKKFTNTTVSNERNEDWKESVSIFHNPNAINKIDHELFAGMRQIWINEEGKLDGEMPDFFVFNSMTVSAIMK